MKVVLFVFLALVATSLAQPPVVQQDHAGDFIESGLAGDSYLPGEVCKPSCIYVTEDAATAESGLQAYVGNCYCTPCWCAQNSTLTDQQSRCSAQNSAALECKIKYERSQEAWHFVTRSFSNYASNNQYVYTPDPVVCPGFPDLRDQVEYNNAPFTTVSLAFPPDFDADRYVGPGDAGTKLDLRCNSQLYVKAPYINGQSDTAARDRSIFGKYWDLIGEHINKMYGDTLTLHFDPPIDGVGMYVRDSSTSTDDSGTTPQIIKITASNGTGHLLGAELNTNFQGSATVGVRRADLLYFYYLQTSCEDVNKIAHLHFTNLDSEDSFSVDDITFFSQGARCAPGTISGHVYSDADQDGNKDIAEVGIAGVEICIFDAEIGCSDSSQALACTTTSSTGHYQFTNLAPGTSVHICERQCNVPDSFWDGIDTPGTFAGVQTGSAHNMSFGTCDVEGHPYPSLWDYFSGVSIGFYENEKVGLNYNFGEVPRTPCEGNPQWCYFNPASGSLAARQSYGAASSGTPYTITAVSSTFTATSIDFGDETEDCLNAAGEPVTRD